MRQVGNPASISIDAEMTAYLDALLEASFAAYDPQYESVAGPIGPSFKWRYSSAYQKAVRRNDPSIKAVAAAMNGCDPAYTRVRVDGRLPSSEPTVLPSRRSPPGYRARQRLWS